MKKFTRVLTIALVLVMILSLLPFGTLAASFSVTVFEDLYSNAGDSLVDVIGNIRDYVVEVGDKAVILDPEDYIVREDGDYDLVGIHTWPLPAPPIYPGDDATAEELEKYNKSMDAFIEEMIKWEENTAAGNGKTALNIPPFPANGTEEEINNWVWQYELIIAAYAPHVHKYSKWYSDATNHWRSCLVCKETHLKMDWHKDADGDAKCDSCEAAIVYYNITIEEVEGAKLVELEGDKDMTAAYRDKLQVEFEAESGYRLVGVRFYKVREDGTESELTRKVITQGEVYGVDMPSFDIKIVPQVAKVG